MAIVHNPDSDYARELEKWNQPTTNGGFGAARFEEYPLMVFKAFKRDNGRVMCGDPLATVGDAEGEAFSRSCQLIVRNNDERDRAMADGWSVAPNKAIEKFEHDMQSIAEVTAQRHFADQGLSDLAKAEATQADAATHEQVPAVPITPVKRKRGRPRKIKV
ncbi:MAG TPA: hypothetical protein DCG16_02920 [Gemmatimonadetes bacterium]|nr:hypothetical protein [Gemmatimonadota bacterium]|tara:strand:- start:298 stop:780 length:483 start_codon:yes stop_codon:yes gene_type:complete